MPDLNGVDACDQIVSELPNTRVLILSMHDTDAIFAAGARGYVLKSDAPRDLVAAVQAIKGNKTFFTAKLSQLMVEGFLNPSCSSPKLYLTPRQREVFQLICEGKGNKEIAVALQVTVKTAETHRANHEAFKHAFGP